LSLVVAMPPLRTKEVTAGCGTPLGTSWRFTSTSISGGNILMLPMTSGGPLSTPAAVTVAVVMPA
jgi:hypothetical protein